MDYYQYESAIKSPSPRNSPTTAANDNNTNSKTTASNSNDWNDITIASVSRKMQYDLDAKDDTFMETLSPGAMDSYSDALQHAARIGALPLELFCLIAKYVPNLEDFFHLVSTCKYLYYWLWNERNEPLFLEWVGRTVPFLKFRDVASDSIPSRVEGPMNTEASDQPGGEQHLGQPRYSNMREAPVYYLLMSPQQELCINAKETLYKWCVHLFGNSNSLKSGTVVGSQRKSRGKRRRKKQRPTTLALTVQRKHIHADGEQQDTVNDEDALEHLSYSTISSDDASSLAEDMEFNSRSAANPDMKRRGDSSPITLSPGTLSGADATFSSDEEGTSTQRNDSQQTAHSGTTRTGTQKQNLEECPFCHKERPSYQMMHCLNSQCQEMNDYSTFCYVCATDLINRAQGPKQLHHQTKETFQEHHHGHALDTLPRLDWWNSHDTRVTNAVHGKLSLLHAQRFLYVYLVDLKEAMHAVRLDRDITYPKLRSLLRDTGIVPQGDQKIGFQRGVDFLGSTDKVCDEVKDGEVITIFRRLR